MTFDPDAVPSDPGARGEARRWVARELRVEGPWAQDGTDFGDLLLRYWDGGTTPTDLVAEAWLAALARDTALHGYEKASAAMQVLLDWCDGRDADPADLELLDDYGLPYELVRRRLIRLSGLPQCTHALDPGWCDCAPALPPAPAAFDRYDFDRPPRDGWEFQVAFWWVCCQLGIRVSDLTAKASRAGLEYVADAYGPAGGYSPRALVLEPTCSYDLRALLLADGG